jgi:hypothetical protein
MATTSPAVWSYLTMSTWEDGSLRETSTISIFQGQSSLQAALNDRDASRVAFVSAESVEGLLAALEAGLQGDSLDWRAAGSKRSGGKSRR